MESLARIFYALLISGAICALLLGHFLVAVFAVVAAAGAGGWVLAESTRP
jgi:hypothetical protein